MTTNPLEHRRARTRTGHDDHLTTNGNLTLCGRPVARLLDRDFDRLGATLCANCTGTNPRNRRPSTAPKPPTKPSTRAPLPPSFKLFTG